MVDLQLWMVKIITDITTRPFHPIAGDLGDLGDVMIG
jgi:hypothetical protein